jgi:hypothetical protein
MVQSAAILRENVGDVAKERKSQRAFVVEYSAYDVVYIYIYSYLLVILSATRHRNFMRNSMFKHLNVPRIMPIQSSYIYIYIYIYIGSKRI